MSMAKPIRVGSYPGLAGPDDKRWGRGGGVDAATIRTAPRPHALGEHKMRTRNFSMAWWFRVRRCSPLEMLVETPIYTVGLMHVLSQRRRGGLTRDLSAPAVPVLVTYAT
jgi:hypothetical protein